MSRLPPKPRSQVARLEITRLPRLTFLRRAFRRGFRQLARFAVWVFTRAERSGLEHFPRQGPALVVANHLGDADAVLAVASLPALMDGLAKIELFDLPVVGWVLDSYGVIWVRRGQPDRRALRASLAALREGRILAIAPEGRESVTGGLEEGTGGAAYLAIKAQVPVVPVTFTGTENARIYPNMKRLKRTPVTLTVGPSFRLESGPDFRASIDRGTQKIMQVLAQQLPPEYQGVFAGPTEASHGST